MNRWTSLALSAGALSLSAGLALAHAELVSANPPVGATVRTVPPEISITFTEEVEPRFSSIQVMDEKGIREDQGAPHTLPDNARILNVGIKPLMPGTYRVIWRATSVDSHKTKGSYQFTFKP
jgi:methionine-rich copper-binding protein CopC